MKIMNNQLPSGLVYLIHVSKCTIDTSVNYNVEDDTTRTRSEFENQLNERITDNLREFAMTPLFIILKTWTYYGLL